MKKSFALMLAITAISLSAEGSAMGRKRPAPASEASTASAPAGMRPTFSWLKANVFVPKCSKCHDGTGGYTDYTNYAEVLNDVKPGYPDDSLIWRVIRSDKMPPRRPVLTQAEKNVVYDWIKRGAKND